jgi:hypothetical protein
MSYKKLTFDQILVDDELYNTYYLAEVGSTPTPDAEPLTLMKIGGIVADGNTVDYSDPGNSARMSDAHVIILAEKPDDDSTETYAVLHPKASDAAKDQAKAQGAKIVDMFDKAEAAPGGRRHRKSRRSRKTKRVTRKKQKKLRKTQKRA